MDRQPLTVTLVTLNEEANLARALKSVAWADEIIVVDSGSTDQTLSIAKRHGAKTLVREWQGYGQQKNFAQSQATHTWVLNIDADEEVSPDLALEIKKLLTRDPKNSSKAIPATPPFGYEIPRKTWYLGRWIMHGGWYPNYLVRLVDRNHARWTEPAIHEELVVQGQVGRLNHALHHFTFSGIQDQVETNLRYSHLGFQQLRSAGRRPSVLKLVLKPTGKFFETYLIKRGFLDGLAGLIISINAAHSVFLKYAYFFESGELNEDSHR